VDIVLRAVVVFVFLWVVTRAAGRATLGELSTFQLILYVTMGDMVQQAVTQQDYSLTGAALAVGTFMLLTVALSYLTWRWPRHLSWVRGTPVVVVRDGEPVAAALRHHRLSFADLATSARQNGIRRLSEVEVAVLEADGRISFFTVERDDGAPSDPDQSPLDAG